MIRGYIETLLELPWDKESVDNMDLANAREILDEDHYGLEKVKERVLEFLAVRALTKKGDSPLSVWWARREPVRLRSPARSQEPWTRNMSGSVWARPG